METYNKLLAYFNKNKQLYYPNLIISAMVADYNREYKTNYDRHVITRMIKFVFEIMNKTKINAEFGNFYLELKIIETITNQKKLADDSSMILIPLQNYQQLMNTQSSQQSLIYKNLMNSTEYQNFLGSQNNQQSSQNNMISQQSSQNNMISQNNQQQNKQVVEQFKQNNRQSSQLNQINQPQNKQVVEQFKQNSQNKQDVEQINQNVKHHQFKSPNDLTNKLLLQQRQVQQLKEQNNSKHESNRILNKKYKTQVNDSGIKK